MYTYIYIYICIYIYIVLAAPGAPRRPCMIYGIFNIGI